MVNTCMVYLLTHKLELQIKLQNLINQDKKIKLGLEERTRF